MSELQRGHSRLLHNPYLFFFYLIRRYIKLEVEPLSSTKPSISAIEWYLRRVSIIRVINNSTASDLFQLQANMCKSRSYSALEIGPTQRHGHREKRILSEGRGVGRKYKTNLVLLSIVTTSGMSKEKDI
jgi:hypothetical protein